MHSIPWKFAFKLGGGKKVTYGSFIFTYTGICSQKESTLHYDASLKFMFTC